MNTRRLAVFATLPLLACAAAESSGTPDAGPEAPKGFTCADHAGMGARVGTLDADLDLRECFIRDQEAPIDDIVSDAIWWAAQDGHFSADITTAVTAGHAKFYLGNSGGLRLKTVMPKGEICATGYIPKTNPGEGDLAKDGKPFPDQLLAFHNPTVLVTMPIKTLRQILERGFGINETTAPATDYPNKDGSFLIWSDNLQVTVDFTGYADKAQKVNGAQTTRDGSLITSLELDGEELDLASDTPITFLTSNFVAGLDMENGDVKAGTTPGQGGAVAAGFSSPYFGAPGVTIQILDKGKDATQATTFTETNAFAKWFAAHPDLAVKASGRLVAKNLAKDPDLCQ